MTTCAYCGCEMSHISRVCRPCARAIRIAKKHPDRLFPVGLTGWPQTGAEVVASFREGMHDRINMRGAL